MKKVNFKKLVFVLTVIAFAVCSCGNNVVKINGDTITLLEDNITISMEKFSFIQQSKENISADEWEVKITSDPELESAILLDSGAGGFYLTPIANIKGNHITIEGINGTGTNFSFTVPKGETPVSYQIKIKNKVLTYHYDKKTWTYDVNDNDFKPAEKMRM